MIFSVSNIAWYPDERLDAYALLAAKGMTGLEIAPGLFLGHASDPFAPTETELRGALNEIAAEGLSLVSMQSLLFGVEGAALFEGAEARDRLERGMHRAIELAGRLAVPNLVFGSPGQRKIPQGMAMTDALDEAAAVFARLGDRALAAGTKIAIEANPKVYGTNFLNRLDEVVNFVERVNHPGIVTILDLGAMHINGEMAGTAIRIPALLPKLNHVHVSEPQLSPAPADPATLAPVLKALRQLRYSYAVSIEMKRPANGLTGVGAAIDLLLTATCAEAHLS